MSSISKVFLQWAVGKFESLSTFFLSVGTPAGTYSQERLHRQVPIKYYLVIFIELLYFLLFESAAFSLYFISLQLVFCTAHLLLIKTNKLKLSRAINILTIVSILSAYMLAERDLLWTTVCIAIVPSFCLTYSIDPKFGALLAVLNAFMMKSFKGRVLSYAALSEHSRPPFMEMIEKMYNIAHLALIYNFIMCYSYYFIQQKFFNNHEQALAQAKHANDNLQLINEKCTENVKSLEETNLKLINLNRELSEALRAKDLLLASASHELRNPLNSLLGNIDLLILEIKEKDYTSRLETIKICGEVLLTLINNIIDVAKMAVDKFQMNYQPTCLYKFIEKIWSISLITIKQKNLVGELYIDKHFPKVLLLDPHRLTQILLNLLGNACKFTDSGSIKVYFTWAPHSRMQELMIPNRNFVKLVKNREDREKEEKGFNNLRVSPSANLEDMQIAFHSFEEIFDQDNSDVEEGKPKLQPIPSDEYSFLSTFQTEKVDSRLFLSTPRFIKDLSIETYYRFDQIGIEGSISAKFNRSKLSPILSDLHYQKGTLKIEIIDTGCGISIESQNRLFKPFVQADASISCKYGGSGLGLYITKQLVDKMDGQITFYSKQNVGSNFIIVIPTEETSSLNIECDCDKSGTSEPLKGEKHEQGLIIDREAGINNCQHKYKHLIDNMGIKTKVCSNEVEVLEQLRRKDVEYRFLIISMHEVSSREMALCKMIRDYNLRMGKEPIPMIVISYGLTAKEKELLTSPLGGIRAKTINAPVNHIELETLLCSLAKKKTTAICRVKPRRLRVLVADDDVFNVSLASYYMNTSGIEFEAAYDGLQAVNKFFSSNGNFDVVIIGAEMPKMNGLEASYEIRRCIKENDIRRDIMIIGMTEHAGKAQEKKCLEWGIDRVLVKPVDFEKLIQSIH